MLLEERYFYYFSTSNIHKVSLVVDYAQLPLVSCASPYSNCVTDRGCHVSIPPCLENNRTDVWYAGVQAQKLFSDNVPVSFTFSWDLKGANPKSLANLTSPVVGTISNGEVKGFYAPYSLFSHPGSWIRYNNLFHSRH